MTSTVQEREHISKEIRTAARHAAVYGLGGVLTKAISVLMLPFYTHYLTPGNYGLLEMLDLSMSLLGMLLHMGISPALLRSYAIAPTPLEKSHIVSTAFLFVLASGLAAFFIGIPLVHPLSIALFGPKIPSLYLLLSFCSLLLSYVANLPRSYLRALESSGTVTALETGSVLGLVLLNIYFIAFRHVGLLGILLSSIIVNACQAMGLSAWLISRVGIHFTSRRLHEMATFGLPLILSNIAIFTLNFSDRFFLQHFRSLDVVGIYAVGYKFGFMINYLLVQPFFVMWQSRMYNIHAQAEHRKIFRQIFIMYSLILLYAALALAILSPEIIRFLADSQFEASRTVIPIVALAYVFYGIGYYAQIGLFLTNKTGVIGMVSAAVAILNLALNYVLVRYFGMMGAAWATLLSFMAIAGGSYWFSQRALRLPLDVIRLALAIALASGLYLISPKANGEAPGVADAIRILMILIFPVLLWAFRILGADELATLALARNRIFVRYRRAEPASIEGGLK